VQIPRLYAGSDGQSHWNEIGDGTRRRFGPGTIFLAEDLSGRGHLARGVGEEDRVSLYIPLGDEN
jgi:hypothetical protein